MARSCGTPNSAIDGFGVRRESPLSCHGWPILEQSGTWSCLCLLRGKIVLVGVKTQTVFLFSRVASSKTLCGLHCLSFGQNYQQYLSRGSTLALQTCFCGCCVVLSKAVDELNKKDFALKMVRIPRSRSAQLVNEKVSVPCVLLVLSVRFSRSF